MHCGVCSCPSACDLTQRIAMVQTASAPFLQLCFAAAANKLALPAGVLTADSFFYM